MLCVTAFLTFTPLFFGQISFSTSVDTETDIEHLTKPFEAGFSISLLKSQVSENLFLVVLLNILGSRMHFSLPQLVPLNQFNY